MKLTIYFYSIILLNNFFSFVQAQPGHKTASIVVDYENYQGIPEHSLLNNYNIRIRVFEEEDSLQFSGETLQYLDSIYIDRYKIGIITQGQLLELPIITPYEINNTILYDRYIKKGTIVGINLEHKKTKRIMTLFIRIGYGMPYFGDNNQLIIYGLEFYEGNFFYDLCKSNYISSYKYSNNGVWIKSKSEADKHSISLNSMRQLLQNNDCTDHYFVLDLKTISNDVKLSLKSFNVRTSEYKNLIGYYDLEKFLEKDIQNIDFKYVSLYLNPSFAIISFENIDKKQMNIYFKIYKRYEDYNRNQITLKNFQFQEGTFFYDMETYSECDCQQPQFVDEFDLSNIQEYAITEEEINKILEENKKN